MIPRVNYNTIRIYESLDFQKHRQSYAYDRVFPLPVLKDTLLPFQFAVPNGKIINSFFLVKVEDNSEIDIFAAATGGGLVVAPGDGFNVVVYPASTVLGTGETIGQYYYKFTIGGVTYYSDIFIWKEATSDLIKIECWHGENIDYSGGQIRYRAPYKSTVYVCSEIGKPSYPYEEEVEERDGYNFPVQQTSYKLHKFVMIAPEYLIDFFRLFRLHDFVEITAKGQVHLVDELIMNDPEWFNDGDMASVLIEFKTDSIVSVNARGVTSLDYTIVQVANTCPLNIVSKHTNHITAAAAGVSAGQYFAYLDFAGIVVQLDASLSYFNDTEASAALTDDSCYAVTIGNPYGLPKNAIRKLNPTTTYTSDALADAGGIASDGIYYAGHGHESAVPYGTALINKTV